MESIRSLPFLKILIPLIIGILLAKFLLQSNWIYFLVFLLLSLLLYFYIHQLRVQSIQGVYLKAIALFVHILCWGFFLSKYQDIQFQKEQNFAALYLQGDWKKKKNYYQCVATTNTKNLFPLGNIIIRIKTDAKPNGEYGDLFLTNRISRRIQSPQNPYQFNYKKYLERKGIAYSLYLKEDEYKVIHKKEFHLKKKFLYLRKKIESLLDSSALDQHSLAFIKALFLGDKSELDSEISEAFSIAGATHVLAVSGLHVGIIVSLFSALLSLIKSKKYRRLIGVLKIFTLLIIIWTFAGITGFSPSIVRASIMFSFISVGQLMTRHANIYNSLSIAAFFMLILNVNYLFDVGFQLSFLAVFGIVYFHPIIYKTLFFKGMFFQKLWSLCAVSIAAQLTTFPIAIYYFHQFPVYFLLSNIIVIPSAFLVLSLSILLLLFHWFTLLSTFLTFVLNTLISSLNYLILSIQELPFNSIQNLALSPTELLLIFLSIFFFILLLQYKTSKSMLALLVCICLFYTFRIVGKIENHTRDQLFVYSIYRRSALNIIHNSDYTLILDSSYSTESKKMEFAIGNHLLNKGLKPLEDSNILLFNKADLIQQTNLIKSKNHLILKNSVLCFNHSSHKTGLLQKFKNRVLFIDKIETEQDISTKEYSHVVLNIWDKSHSLESLISRNRINTRKIHNIKEDGYFSLTLP